MSRLRPHLSFSNVISLIALFAALGGSAYAVKIKLKSNSVKTKHIAPDAATGEDIAEGTLGNVPSATNATNATNAGNAETVGGLGLANLQFGDGEDTAVAGVFEDLNGPGAAIAGISLIEGNLGFDCDDSPTLEYADDNDDGGVPTDIWVNGSPGGNTSHDHYELLGDGGSVAPLLVGLESTSHVQLWGGGGWVAHVVASISVNTTPSPDQCTVAFSAQENTESGPSFSAEGSDENRDDREEPPGDWVPLDRSR